MDRTPRVSHLFEMNGRVHAVAPSHGPGGFAVEIDGVASAATLDPIAPGEYLLRIDGRAHPIYLAMEGERIFVHVGGRSFEISEVNRLERLRREARAARGDQELIAPMPGVVVEVRVTEGQPVSVGDTLVVIESMKLQTALSAEVDGFVTSLRCAAGQSFEKGAVLARVESAMRKEME